MATYRVKTKRNRIMGVVGFGPMTPDKREQHFYDFFLVEKLGLFKARKYKIPAKRGQLLRQAEVRAEQLLSPHPVEAQHLISARQALCELIVRRQHLVQAWDHLLGGNQAALEVEITNANAPTWNPYEREVRVLRITDDVEAVTAPNHALKRGRALGHMLGLNGRNDRLAEEESAYLKAKRDPDVRPVRPELFRELELSVLELTKSYRETLVLTQKAERLCEVALRGGSVAEALREEMSRTVNVRAAGEAEQTLHQLPLSPAVEELALLEDELQRAGQARDETRRVWKELS